MPWKCPPLHLPNWNNLWKWKEQMNPKDKHADWLLKPTANELADKLLEDLKEIDLFNVDSDMYGNQQHYIQQLENKVRQQQAEIEALNNLVAKQDKKIIDLAFKLAYAERSNEIVLEVNTRRRP